MKCYHHLCLLDFISFFLASPYVLSSYALNYAVLSSPFSNFAQGARLSLQTLNYFLSSGVKSSFKAGATGVAGAAGVAGITGIILEVLLLFEAMGVVVFLVVVEDVFVVPEPLGSAC